MARWFSLVFAMMTVAPLWAQTQHPCPSAFDLRGFDDGGSERIWKLANPSGPSEWFNVDFDNTLIGETVLGLAVAFDESTQEKTATWAKIGLYPPNLTVSPSGSSPDTSAPILEIPGGDEIFNQNCEFGVFRTPETVITGPVHIAFQHTSGDSAMWLCSDTSSPATGRSFFSTTNYASPASSFTINWMLRAAVLPPTAVANTLLIDGSTAATAAQLDEISFQYWGDPGDLSVLFTAPPLPVSKISPILPAGFNGMSNRDWILCDLICCNFPVSTLSFNVFALQSATNMILKSNTATLSVVASPVGCGFCYGQLDDGAFDGFVFRVSNPAGSNDWFNVRHGTPSEASCINYLTAIEVATWDFCGTGGSWAEVGLYPADFTLSSAGNFPDLANPFATVGGASAPIPAGTADWGYPAQAYDIPDIPVSFSETYHVAAQWTAGDSCIFMASDTTNTGPDPCGSLPNSTSYSSSDGYVATAGAATSINWMMKVDWR